MSQFYNKYKNLFLQPGTSAKNSRSYIRPYANQMALRAQSLHYNPNLKAKQKKQLNYQSNPTRRFQTQILPELNRLNEQTRKKKIHTQISQPIYYTPIMSNKYKNFQLSQSKPSTLKFGRKTDQKFRQNFYKVQSNPIYSEAKQREVINPQAQAYIKRAHQPEPQTTQKSEKSLKTEPIYLQKEKMWLPIIDNPKINSEHPQSNYSIMFSEHQTQNQFELINRRIKDIRWIERFYPRGSINQYREALLRRKQGKIRIDQRRNKLKKLIAEQTKEYYKNKPII